MNDSSETLAQTSDSVVKRKRQRLPKVRTGCKTCKARRVKCDEGKPGCQRCEKSGWDCDGYPQKPARTRPLLPRLSPNFLPIFFQPRININGDEHENRYFRYFSENMAHEIAGYFDWELWTRLFPRACQSEESLRHVIIAMAASRIADEDPLNPHNSTGNTHWHRQSALRHYSRAIKAMKENSIKGNQDPRSILLNCIILLCFEAMHYHQASGVQQAVIITKLIDNTLVENGQLTEAALEGRMATKLGKDLHEILGGLDTLTRLCLNTRTARQSAILKRCGERSLASMPSHFHSLQESRGWLTLICFRLNQFLDSITLDLPEVDYFLPDTMSCIPADLEDERKRLVNEHTRWKEAFDSFVACAPVLSDREILGIRQLELHYLTSYFSGAVARASDESWPNTRRFMTEFARIVEISKAILEESNGKGKTLFVFGMQVVCPLTVVGWRCPDKKVRRKAIELLRSYPRREGLLTGFINADLVEKVMLAEERNCGEVGEYIPDDMRCAGVILNVSTAEAERLTSIQCRLPTKLPGVWVTTHDEVCW